MIWAALFSIGVWLSIAKLAGARFLEDVSWWLTTAPIWGSVSWAIGWIACAAYLLKLNPFMALTEEESDGIKY